MLHQEISTDLSLWLQRKAGLTAPMAINPVAGGRSNLTFRIVDAKGQKMILRRPPAHGVLPSAHDMGREYSIMSALQRTEVPVPKTVAYESSTDVMGAPFYVTEEVQGIVARDREGAEKTLSGPVRAAASESLIRSLIRLHVLEPDDVGLGDLGRREDYVSRQLRRWSRQLQAIRNRDTSSLLDIGKRLAKKIPPQERTSIVHGDYKLDNVILDPSSGELCAILDWELTTLGDPMADLGLLLVYWPRPGDELLALPDAPSLIDGFWERDSLVETYARGSDIDTSDVPYFVAFGYWKLSCILEGVYSRYVNGAYGYDRAGFESLGHSARLLKELAAEAVTEIGA